MAMRRGRRTSYNQSIQSEVLEPFFGFPPCSKNSSNVYLLATSGMQISPPRGKLVHSLLISLRIGQSLQKFLFRGGRDRSSGVVHLRVCGEKVRQLNIEFVGNLEAEVARLHCVRLAHWQTQLLADLKGAAGARKFVE